MSTTPQSAEGIDVAFTERLIQTDGFQVRVLEAGQGKPVVVFRGSDSPASSPLNNLLTRQFRVLTLEVPNFDRSQVNEQFQSMRNLAHTLAEVVTALGLERYGVVSDASSAPFALWQAIDLQDRVEALVLISPTVLFLEGWTGLGSFNRDLELAHRLGEIQAATLVLFGTRDSVIPPETGRLYVERIPNCYYALVYDAGHVIEAERPEALFAAVRDFLEHRETFIVGRKNTIINP